MAHFTCVDVFSSSFFSPIFFLLFGAKTYRTVCGSRSEHYYYYDLLVSADDDGGGGGDDAKSIEHRAHEYCFV